MRYSPEHMWGDYPVEQIRRNYRRMFLYYASFYEVETKKLEAVSIGCRYGLEAGGLIAAFEGKEVSYLGIDIDGTAIIDAKYRANPDLRGRKVEFKAADATLDEAYMGNQFDIVYAGHPDVRGIGGKQVVGKGLEVVKPGGLFISTTFYDHERRWVEELVADQALTIVTSEKNKYAGEPNFPAGFVTVGVKLL